MNDLICSSSVMPLRDRTSNSLVCDIKSSNYLRPIIDRNHLVKNCKTRSHVKHGLLWLDCDSQNRTKLANLWEIFDRILKNGIFDAWSFWFKKESFWFQKLAPWWPYKVMGWAVPCKYVCGKSNWQLCFHHRVLWWGMSYYHPSSCLIFQ
jgi:hypothetical protein